MSLFADAEGGLATKDVVTGSIAVASLLLGLYNLRRTIATERRTELKPYFASKWESINAALYGHFLWSNSAGPEAEGKSDPERQSDDYILTIPRPGEVPSLDSLSAKYDPTFTVLLNQYREAAAEFEKAIEEHNQLVDPVTPSFSYFSLAVQAGQPLGLGGDETPDEREGRTRKRIAHATEITQKYCGSRDDLSVKDLAENPTYRDDLKSCRQAVRNASERLRDAHAKLEARVKLLAEQFKTNKK